MQQAHPRYKRKFSLRWRGRRWYDPNERKVLWSSLCFILVTALVRLFIVGDFLIYPTPLAAKIAPSRGLSGTAHDLSATGLNHVTASKEVCIFCHTPHDSPEGIKGSVPIWNHATTSQQFLVYSSPSLKGIIDAQPTGPSLACLSCHDGTLAMGALHELPIGGGQDDYSQATGGVNTTTGLMEGTGRIGRNLSSAHPISIAYRDDLDKSLRPPSELQGVRLYPSNVRGAKVQCGSCHDPHNFGIKGSTAPFLRVSKEGSTLCLSCHLM